VTQWHSQESDNNLGDGDIHIWLSYLNLHEARLKHLYPLLDAGEKERSERFKFYKHRKRFIASHGFMRSVLSLYTHTPAELIEFDLKEQGKPELIANSNKTDIHFNLSHSNNLALLAIRKSHEVGIDVEFMEKKHEWNKVIKRFFTEPEQNAIFSLPENEQRSAFFKVWTRKEAHMKVTGQGLHLPPTQFTVSVPPKKAQFIEHINTDTDQVWHMQDIELPETFNEYVGCLSSAETFEKTVNYIFK
jgi:4'-phosphopantetheinyl transferase